MKNLAAQGVSAVKWGTVTTAARFTLQLGLQVVLARLLGPDTFGLFAMGLLVFMFVSFLADFGFGWGLVQRIELTAEDIRFAFTWQVITGVVVACALYLLADAVAAFFRDSRLVPIVQWLSLACVSTAAGAPAVNLLRREMNFRALGLIQLGSYATGYGLVGLSLALAGAGVWSLLCAWLVQSAVAAIAGYALCRHAVRPLFWYAGARSMLGVSSTVFVTNICNWFATNLDRLILGRLANAQAVGLYSAGYNLANLPNVVLMGVLQPAFLAAGARMQEDPNALRRAYLQILSAVWVLLAPFFVLLAACAQPLVALLYGPAWSGTAAVLAILALAMPAFLSFGMSTPVLWNTGRKHYEVLLQLPVIICLALVLSLFVGFDAKQTAWCALGAYTLRGAVMVAAALTALQVPVRQWLPNLVRGVVLCSAVGVAALLASTAAAQLGSQPLLLLAAAVLGGLIVPLLGLVLAPGLLGVEAQAVVVRFWPQSRAWFNKQTDAGSQQGGQ